MQTAVEALAPTAIAPTLRHARSRNAILKTATCAGRAGFTVVAFSVTDGSALPRPSSVSRSI